LEDSIKREIQLLINEASIIAPSIARFDASKNYGTVTDENFDLPAFTTWNIRTKNLFKQLVNRYENTFSDVFTEFTNYIMESERNHSKSIYVHQITMLLNTSMELLNSSINTSQSKNKVIPIEVPEKLTINWLYKHVAFKHWVAVILVLISTFTLGYKVALKGVELGAIKVTVDKKI
jgi:hypothetical protein